MPKVNVAVAWLRQEDWLRWQAVDPNLRSYEDWLLKIETLVDQVERGGKAVPEKILVDPDEFISWASERGFKIDRFSRSQYAAEILNRRSSH